MGGRQNSAKYRIFYNYIPDEIKYSYNSRTNAF